jgi:hypothetical protein
MKNILLITLFLHSLCNAQNARPEREAFILKLAVDGEQYYNMEVNKTPYFVKEKILQIYPGDQLLIETEIKGDTIFSMKVVAENKFPKKTIILNFAQEIEGRAHLQMMLSVTNPFDKSLIYDAAMYRVGKDSWSKTSIIPIRPGLINFETWADIIITLILENWRFKI